MSHIAVFHWTVAIELAFCGVLQRCYINHHNIHVLVALDIAIAALYKPVAINILFCGILQRRYIKPLQYISFSGISVTYSGGLDDCRNRYIYAVLFISYSSSLYRRNRTFNSLHLVQCIPLLFWPKHHFGFSFPSYFHFPMYPFVFSSKKKNPLSLSLSVQAFSSLVLYHQSSLTSFVDTTRKISLTVISYNHHCRQYPKINIKKNLTDPTSHHLVGTKANSSSKSIAIVRH